MKIPQRKAVSPIIATLLLIAITVAAGVVVYVFVGGLSSNLSKSGGNQVTEQLSMDAYTSSALASNSTVQLTLRNTGSGALTISSVYFDGSSLTIKSTNYVAGLVVPAGTSNTVSLLLATFASNLGSHLYIECGSIPGALVGGTSHQVKVVTVDGAIFTFNVIAGSSG